MLVRASNGTHSLAIRHEKRSEVDQSTDTIWYPLCRQGDGGAAKAMANQNNWAVNGAKDLFDDLDIIVCGETYKFAWLAPTPR
ncbi:hypothetical protein CNE_BB1p09090 (plasmid) [Cupriavidus necator N-1]|uniref:Uncharacterized protein n=1 Tax=Cupriavidus necator (strain ATCC 43291 / DSM 13513 / CCUG 52238 / LMG 8453 / N-1) TaxID=1042878 RepID=F8GUB7_CUPNN|nr:hypothetical protein CNE_BB1p09090 [Cupriavidus necator N-1]